MLPGFAAREPDTYIYEGDVDVDGNPTGWGSALLCDITMAESRRWQKVKGTWLNGSPEGIVKITYFGKEANFCYQEMYTDGVLRAGRGTHYFSTGKIWNIEYKGNSMTKSKENITETPKKAYYCPKGSHRTMN